MEDQNKISRKCHRCDIERCSIKFCIMQKVEEANGNVRLNNSEKQPLVRLHAMRAMGMFV